LLWRQQLTYKFQYSLPYTPQHTHAKYAIMNITKLTTMVNVYELKPVLTDKTFKTKS